jgi:hypothetical protein
MRCGWVCGSIYEVAHMIPNDFAEITCPTRTITTGEDRKENITTHGTTGC